VQPITRSGPDAIEQAKLFEFGVQHIATDVQKARSLQLIIPAVLKSRAIHAPQSDGEALRPLPGFLYPEGYFCQVEVTPE
jgi:hypothetical protein